PQLPLLDSLDCKNVTGDRGSRRDVQIDAAAIDDLDVDHPALLPPLRSGLLRMQLVSLDDALDELVADDVLVAETDERDAVDPPEDVLDLNQARCLLARQVDLRDVAGDDDLRAEPEARQEHLHLLGARVLRLVE